MVVCLLPITTLPDIPHQLTQGSDYVLSPVMFFTVAVSFHFVFSFACDVVVGISWFCLLNKVHVVLLGIWLTVVCEKVFPSLTSLSSISCMRLLTTYQLSLFTFNLIGKFCFLCRTERELSYGLELMLTV